VSTIFTIVVVPMVMSLVVRDTPSAAGGEQPSQGV
jgi:hypothetical protein